MKSTLYVEYQEKQLEEKDLVAKAKKVWTSTGKKVSELTSRVFDTCILVIL